MNVYEAELLLSIDERPFSTQRELAERSGLSLGLINRTLQRLREEGFLDENSLLTEKAVDLLERRKPRRAVILAAGFGMRMIPVNTIPKALLQVHGERLIERLIRQLQDVGIREITVVAGYQKEQFEYLIDRFGVELVYNPAYAEKNNLHSLALVADRIQNCYIVPCDIRCEENPFREHELLSWYMVSEETDPASDVRVNRKRELVRVDPEAPGNRMIGISFLCGEQAEALAERLRFLDREARFRAAFWEEALYGEDRMSVSARLVPAGFATEINTYEQLRELDAASGSLNADAIRTICQVFSARPKDISEISVLKKGMTNRSFLFRVRDAAYIMRIPGEGTDRLINRGQEAKVYDAIKGKGLCDDPVYLDPKSGYKITRYLPQVRVCDPSAEEDLLRCMRKLRDFHRMNLQVDHRFDLFGQIDFYESLWPSGQSMFLDYAKTKAKVFALKDYIDRQEKPCCLTHIDAVKDNFLLYPAENGDEALQLTDWEYAGMQDPHVDLAMFSVYSYFDRRQADHLIDLYFENRCPPETRVKIYCYVAACGLLWSNWCEYKSSLGVEFGEYSLRQYRAAKEFARHAVLAMSDLETKEGKA